MNRHTGDKPSAGFAAKPPPSPPAGQGAWIIIASVAAVVLSVAMEASFMTPFLTGAALGPFFYGAMRKNDLRSALSLTARWAVSVFIASCIVCLYLPERTAGSIPFADTMIRAVTEWLSGTSHGAPFGPAMILGGVLVFAVLSLLSGGMAAILAGGGAVSGAACVFSHLMRHGENIVQVTLVGMPPWIIAFAFSVLFIMVPAARPFYRRIHRGASGDPETTAWRTYAIIGAAFGFAGVILHLALGGAWNTVLNACTVF
ncbi:MAG: hypothetical protein HY770_02815 [Chitinivibrionia bacterium]|nr:hypothetical protein [Chitinivibrionia bacterium]